MRRDCTYVGDLAESVVSLMAAVPVKGRPVVADGVSDSLSPVAPWRVVNIGGGAPVGLLELIEAVETAVGRLAEKNFLPRQPGDVAETFADPGLLAALTGFVPATPIMEWVTEFVEWYQHAVEDERASLY